MEPKITISEPKTVSAKTTAMFNLGSALFALCVWGGWAYYVNQHSSTGLASAISQGSASFVITLGMVYAVTWLHGHLRASSIRLFLPAIITVSITGSGLYLIHSIVGTPNIAFTIAPALSVAFIFCVFTSYKLNRLSSNTSQTNNNPSS